MQFSLYTLLLVVIYAAVVDCAPVGTVIAGGNTALVEPTARIVVKVQKRSGRYWEPWELNNNICPPSLCTSSDEIRPRGTGSSVFYNGDIVLDSETERFIYGDNPNRLRYKRATSRSRRRLWRNGIVPYTWASDILPLSKRALKKAMKHIEEHTCIKFKSKKAKDDNYIRFISEPGCWSNIGKVGGEQKLSIGRGCERTGTAIHEVTHALGIWHEQSRPDRDNYIRILEENVSPDYLPDFNKINGTVATSRGFPYDYESVMHYSEMAFSELGDPTIEVIGIGRTLGVRIGQRDGLSTLDIAQLRDMYYCNKKEDANATFCPKGWLKKGNSCYKFESKLQYQFAQAWRHCESQDSRLLHIDTKTEDDFIKKRLKSKFSDIPIWRTGGRLVNGTFVWYTGDKNKKMYYTAWKKGHPSTFSSMALVYNETQKKFNWEGVWLGSASQMPQFAHPFICEKRSKRKCIRLQHADGRDYNGTLDHTVDGITCQKWSSQYPHRHTLLPYPYREPTTRRRRDGLGDHNYCRNPAGQRRDRPWCFTGKGSVEWQYCDVTACSSQREDLKLASNKKVSETGKVDEIILGSNKKNTPTRNTYPNQKPSYDTMQDSKPSPGNKFYPVNDNTKKKHPKRKHNSSKGRDKTGSKNRTENKRRRSKKGSRRRKNKSRRLRGNRRHSR